MKGRDTRTELPPGTEQLGGARPRAGTLGAGMWTLAPAPPSRCRPPRCINKERGAWREKKLATGQSE